MSRSTTQSQHPASTSFNGLTFHVRLPLLLQSIDQPPNECGLRRHGLPQFCDLLAELDLVLRELQIGQVAFARCRSRCAKKRSAGGSRGGRRFLVGSLQYALVSKEVQRVAMGEGTHGIECHVFPCEAEFPSEDETRKCNEEQSEH